MSDDPRLTWFGRYTPEGGLTPGYGDQYLFFAGRDDIHGVLLSLISAETMGFKFNMFGYDDNELNGAVMKLLGNPNVAVQATLDLSQSHGVHERQLLESDQAHDPDFYNSVIITQSATHQISHTKGGVLVSQGLFFEGSVNWSDSGEGTGIRLAGPPAPGFKAQNNTLLVSSNPVAFTRFSARLDTEHVQVLHRTRRETVAHPGGEGLTVPEQAGAPVPPKPGQSPTWPAMEHPRTCLSPVRGCSSHRGSYATAPPTG